MAKRKADRPNLPNTAPEWQRDGAGHVWHPYTQMHTAAPPLPVARTEGCTITLSDGRTLIDGTASWWTACFGYNHPHIVGAARQQLETMPHVMFGGLAHEPAYDLARRIAALTPGDLDHVFFAEGGSVAVEVAMKMAIQYFINRGESGRTRFVSFLGGYHGDTFAAMSVCDPEDGMHRLFSGAMPRNHILPLPDTSESLAELDDLLAREAATIAAVMVEPLIQGAGGMRMHDPQVLRDLRALCDRHAVLLIFDEIFTGFGRTGTLFASEQADVLPDILCIGKAMTGGTMPLSATVARSHVYDAFLSDDPSAALMHGPTFMANPLACAAANAALDLFEKEDWAGSVARIEAQMREELACCAAFPGVVAVRVKGAVGAVELDSASDNEWIKSRFLECGVWLRPVGNVVYMTPPFTIAPDELRQLTDAVVHILRERGEGSCH